MHVTGIGTVAIKPEWIQWAGKPLQKIALKTAPTQPDTFWQKWQSAMNGTLKTAKTKGLENLMGSKTESIASSGAVVLKSSIGAVGPAATGIKPATCVVMKEVKPDTAAASTSDTEAVAQNKADGAGPVVTLAGRPDLKADPQSKMHTSLRAVPAQILKEKQEAKPAASGSRPYAAVDNNPHVSDAAAPECLRPELVVGKCVTSTSDLSDGFPAPCDARQAPANLPFASHTNHFSIEGAPHEIEKARGLPTPVVCATASPGAFPATSPLAGQLSKHSVQSGGVAPIAEATHFAVNSVTPSEVTISHAPTQTARPLTNTVSPAVVPLSAFPNHANSTQGAGMSDQWLVASGPTHLDVGVFDGTHGWLRVRAELNPGGAVYASLTANATAHVSLKSALPEMTNYLVSEAVGVSKIAVHRFLSPNDATSGQSNGDAAGFGGSNQRGQDSGPHKQRSVGTGNFNQPSESTTTPGAILPLGFSSGMSGSWLNVCA